MDLLTLIVLVPFITAFVIAALPVERTDLMKRSALFGTSLGLGLAIHLTFTYLAHMAEQAALGANETYILKRTLAWFPTLDINYSIGVDGVSVVMTLLTSIVIFAGVLASWHMKNRVKEFFALLLLLVGGVYGVFISIDFFLLFLFYEIAVLPMYLLIGVWGTGKKEYSAMKLTLMLMAGSAFIFAGIFGLYFISAKIGTTGHGSFDILELATLHFPKEAQNWIFPCLFVGFGVIGALFPFHTWSPDGHASAPTSVSMLHAGVLMKLGGYGCLRAIYILPEGAKHWAMLFLVLTTINIFYGGLIAVRKTDLKYITAYSSVSHCGMVLFGLMVLTLLGMEGAILQSFSHGIMTALFFALIGAVYERTHTRDVAKLGGLMQVMPYAGVCYFIAGFAALGLPGMSGFVAEITIFIGSWGTADPFIRLLTIFTCASVVVAAVYMLRTVTKVFYGKLEDEHFLHLPAITFQEKAAFTLLSFVLIFVGIFPGWVMSILEFSLVPVVKNLSRIG
ncbi:MAG: NADH-quinone oxidoreductase subunit M [bacterium]|nr:NADH-quinone oxidoreductase subunit M [bacterium]